MCYCKELPHLPFINNPLCRSHQAAAEGPWNPHHVRPARLLLSAGQEQAVDSQPHPQSDQEFMCLVSPCDCPHPSDVPQVNPPHHAFGAMGTLPLRFFPGGGRKKPSWSFGGQIWSISTARLPMPYFSQLATAKPPPEISKQPGDLVPEVLWRLLCLYEVLYSSQC